MMLLTNSELQFDQGIMRLSSFDPLSNQMKTRILCLPELPALESLEHLFTTPATPSPTKDSSNSSSSLRVSKSLVSKSSAARHGKAPRRCYSNPSLSKMNGESHRSLRRSSSKRSLSNAFHALIKRAKRMSRPSTSSWRTETVLMDMDDSDERPSKKKRCNQNARVHVENWWSSSPPLLQASF